MSWYNTSSKQVDKVSCMVRATSAAIVQDLGISSRTDHGVGDFSYTLDDAWVSSTHHGQAEAHIGTGSAWATTNSSRATSSNIATETFLYTGAQGDYSHDLQSSGSHA